MKSLKLSLRPAAALGACAVLAGTAVAAAPAHAGGAPHADPAVERPALEFPRDYVPATAKLVAHVDVARFQGTELWRLIEPHRAELGLDEVRAELGVDPLDVVRSVTIYGTEGEPHTVLVLATDAVDGLLERFVAEGELDTFHENGVDLFRVDDGVGHVAPHGASGRIVVLSDSTPRMFEALSVIGGRTESLADTRDSGLRPEPVVGSFLFLAASGMLPGIDDFEPASQVLGLAQGVQFDLGEAGGSLFAHLALDTGSVETARDVADTVQGLLALARIAIRAADEAPPGVEDLLYALAVRTRGGAVSVDFEYSVRALVDLVESLEQY